MFHLKKIVKIDYKMNICRLRSPGGEPVYGRHRVEVKIDLFLCDIVSRRLLTKELYLPSCTTKIRIQTKGRKH